MTQRTLTKDQYAEVIGKAIEQAEKAGYTVVIASDEEANTFNQISSQHCIYGDTQKNIIALGVHSSFDDEVFLED